MLSYFILLYFTGAVATAATGSLKYYYMNKGINSISFFSRARQIFSMSQSSFVQFYSVLSDFQFFKSLIELKTLTLNFQNGIR